MILLQDDDECFQLTIAILNPIPKSPSKFSLGILQSSNIKLQVDDALMPNLSSFFPSENPGIGFGTMKALIPCRIANRKVAI